MRGSRREAELAFLEIRHVEKSFGPIPVLRGLDLALRPDEVVAVVGYSGAGKSYAATQGAHTRLLLNLGFDGLIVRGRPKGTWINSEYPWSLTEDWLRDGGSLASDIDATTGAAELARCYVARFGPATTADLQWWAGWTTGTTRKALAAIEAVQVEMNGTVGWVLPDDLPTGREKVSPWIAFLPALDPTTMGWKERSWYLHDLGAFGTSVFDRNGNAGPTIWVDGHVVGAWAQRKSGEIAYRLLTDVDKARHKAIAAEAERVRVWIGDARVNVRFPAPIQKDLLE